MCIFPSYPIFRGYKKRADYPEKLRQKQLLQRFEAMANAPPKKRAIIPAAELSGTKERLSMNTVIEIHHPNKNNAHHNYGIVPYLQYYLFTNVPLKLNANVLMPSLGPSD